VPGGVSSASSTTASPHRACRFGGLAGTSLIPFQIDSRQGDLTASLHPPTLPGPFTTARQVLLDQLTLLEAKLGEVLEAVAKGDTDRLLAHGRFLEDRFGASELDVGRRGA
jgi:hypothetical protein